jgi:transcriptional regulator GlxA family with amidase domain
MVAKPERPGMLGRRERRQGNSLRSGRRNRMADPVTFPRTLRIGIFVFDLFEPIDVFGFVEAFSIARFPGTEYDSPPPYPFEIKLIGRTKANVQSINGPWVAPDWDFAQALREPLDMLMVPGGAGTWPLLDEAKYPDAVAALFEWMRAMNGRVNIMASVCTGAAVLARCGFLDGLRAATNHGAFDWVAAQGPRVHWDRVARWVDAGKYVTSAGVSAGTDMGFYLVSRLTSRAVAEEAVRAAEYDWHRDPMTPIYYPPQTGD